VVYVIRWKYFLIVKQTRCTNFSNLFLEQNSTCFGQFLCPSSGVFLCTHSSGICHTGLLTAFEQDQDSTAVLSWSRLQAVSKPVWHIPLLCVQWETPDDGQRNCLKHAEFYSKNKFEKLVHLVGFIIKIYHDTRSPEHQVLWDDVKWGLSLDAVGSYDYLKFWLRELWMIWMKCGTDIFINVSFHSVSVMKRFLHKPQNKLFLQFFKLHIKSTLLNKYYIFQWT